MFQTMLWRAAGTYRYKRASLGAAHALPIITSTPVAPNAGRLRWGD